MTDFQISLSMWPSFIVHPFHCLSLKPSLLQPRLSTRQPRLLQIQVHRTPVWYEEMHLIYSHEPVKTHSSPEGRD